MQLSHQDIQNKNLTFNFIQDGILVGLLMDGRGKKIPSLKLSHISYNDKTWHCYTLPTKDPKNI